MPHKGIEDSILKQRKQQAEAKGNNGSLKRQSD